jgi:hypothetical protein
MFKKAILVRYIAVALLVLPLISAAQKIAVPSYFYPNSDWCDPALEESEAACNWKILDNASDTVSIAIINPERCCQIT